MTQSTFDITLKQPLIISQQAASAGPQLSLDYLPGSVLLGLVASRLYASLDSDSAWIIFHSGLVRFGDALPLHNNEIALPIPMCWHAFKGLRTNENNRLIADNIFDLSQKDRKDLETKQPVQMRFGYITASGAYIVPRREQTLKTAIDANTGMAAESQLFGYEALSAGQKFRCTVSAHDALDPKLWKKLQETLVGEAHLGRSRSAQFGRVSISQAKTHQTPPLVSDNRILTLWLTSDMLLLNQGQPCLTPHPELLGLPAGTVWNVENSFLRTRRYSTYNAFRRHYDSERQVISRGSVLRYTLSEPLSNSALQALENGIGLAAECGTGQLRVNPSLLATTHPVFTRTAPTLDAKNVLKEPESKLIRVLQSRLEQNTDLESPTEAARGIFSALCEKIRQARRYLALPDGSPLEGAPGRSQWGRLKELASSQRQFPTKLWTELTHPTNGILRERSGWDLACGPYQEDKLLRELLRQLNVHQNNAWLPSLIGQLAARGLSDEWTACCDGKELKEYTA